MSLKDQRVNLTSLESGAHTVSWTEPTGTSVAVMIDLAHRQVHGVIFFPRWVWDDPPRQWACRTGTWTGWPPSGTPAPPTP